MHIYINESLNLYPRFPGDIQLIDPDWTVDKPLPEGWETVTPAPAPEITPGQIFEEIMPEKIDGVWHQKWLVRDMTEEELEILRLQQEEVLKEYNESIQQA